MVGQPQRSALQRHRPYRVLALAFALSLLASPVTAADVPPCRMGDEVVAYDGGRWGHLVIDTWWRLSSAYAPNDLVSVRRAHVSGSGKVRAFLIDDLSALAADARASGIHLAVQSAYRSYTAQASTFRQWVRKIGPDRASKTSARAGHSEHQLGTAIDFKSPGGSAPWHNYPRWERTPISRWLAANAWRHGFVLSYPKGTYQTTCYAYEPWHYRYVGHDAAQAIQQSGQPPRVWLLTNPSPSQSPQPTPTTEPAVQLTAEATAEPSPAPSTQSP